MYRWKASFSAWVLTGSPVEDRKITVWYWARLVSVKRVSSSVASTVKLLAAPRVRMAWMPAGIESCRKPVVLEKTSTLNGAAAALPGAAWLGAAVARRARAVHAA